MSVEYKDSGITFENRNFDGVLWYQPRALSESLSDSVTPSDSLIKGIDPVYADSVSVSDNFVKDFGINLSDSVIARDSKYVVFRDRSGVLFESRPGVVWSEYSEDIVKEVSKPLTDSITTTDALSNDLERYLNDSVTPTDAIAEKSLVKPIVDSITPVDSIITKHFGKVLSDSATADDTTNVLFKDHSDVLFENRSGVIWTETRRDMIVKHIEKPLTDSATPSDLITDKFVTMVLTDSITITDNIYNHPGLFFWDEYEYSDLITVMKLDGTMPYVKPENTAFSEMRIKSIYGREPSNFYEIDEQGEEE